MALRKITKIYTKIHRNINLKQRKLNSDKKKYKKQSHRSLDGL